MSFPHIYTEYLKLRQHFIWYDGPFVTLFEADGGDLYIYYWCEDDHKKLQSRWLVFGVTQEQVDSYLAGQTSLLELQQNPVDGKVHLLEMDSVLLERFIRSFTPDELPEDYRPTEESFYDPMLAREAVA